MPDMGDGLKIAIMGPILGFLASAVVSAVLPASMPGAGNGLAVLFNLVSIIVGIGSLQSAKYWGLLYSAGYFRGNSPDWKIFHGTLGIPNLPIHHRVLHLFEDFKKIMKTQDC